jgi:PIN domain nuclease of toxin-antitoxin system
MVVLDTHATVWWTLSPTLLSSKANDAIERAERLGIPAIVFWEVSLLVRKKRLDLGLPVQAWADELRSISRVVELPLTADMALKADQLSLHPDPADRFLVATALHHNVPLVTKDKLLRKFKGVKTVW